MVNGEKKLTTTSLGQEGGTRYSGDGLVRELERGNTTTLAHAMGGSEQEKRDYASQIAKEAQKLADVKYGSSKANKTSVGLNTKFGTTGTNASFSTGAEYSKQQTLAVNQMTAQVSNILGSSSSPAVAMQRIQALRGEMDEAARSGYKSMNFGDRSSSPDGRNWIDRAKEALIPGGGSKGMPKSSTPPPRPR